MLCPVCGRPTRVLTRSPLHEGAERITRVCTVPERGAHAGNVFQTVEVLAPVVTGVGPGVVARYSAEASNGMRFRALAAERKRLVRELRGQLNVVQIAQRLQITDARVRQIFKELDA